MNIPLTEDGLIAIEQRAAEAREIAVEPWLVWLESQGGLGGESFIQLNGDSTQDDEIYVSLHLDGHRLHSPDPRVDAVIDFLGHAMQDVQGLVTEVRRLRMLAGDQAAS